MWQCDLLKGVSFQSQLRVKIAHQMFTMQCRKYLEIEIKKKKERIIVTEKTIAKTSGRGIPLTPSSGSLSDKISVLQKPENKFKVSISPTFYKQLFHTKVFCTAFMCLQFRFVIF